MLDSELYDREFDDNENRGRGASEVNAGASVPAAVFQPPQVVFQPPPAAPPPVARPASGAAASGGGASGGGASGGAASGGDADGADGSESGEGGSGRRRRRKPSRGRARADGTDGADSAEGADGAEAGARTGEDVGPQGEQDPAGTSGENEAQPSGSRRSRRSRSRGASAESGGDEAAAGDGAATAGGSAAEAADDDAAGDSADDDSAGDSASGRRRRRKRRRGSADGSDVLTADDPPDTVVHVRESADDVRSVKGSTRLEAKKQRRREGRETGRRRPPIITESEFLARRESVERTMVVRQREDRTQIAVLEDGVLVEHYVNRSSHQSYVGNVYFGKVQNVLPSMEAAFVDIGKGRNAVLYAGEVNFDVSGLEGQPKRIESALKAGQSLIVQVTKDPVGHKGARLTSQVSLPGRYLVYVPGASMTGISRKLPDTERNRLKQILKKVMPENAGVIVRTAAEGAAEEELSRDVARLAAQWEAIEKKSKTASAPSLLYSEPDLTIRVIRDVFNEDFSKLVVAGDQGWDTVDEYVRYVAPHLAERLSRWSAGDGGSGSGEDVFAAHRIDEQLAKALERKVWLPSGGSLVIDKTEAMTVIDVNTGKFTGQGGNLEETVTRNNLEAAEEIVRQLRLRDVGGIVVIDFIDMVLESNRELVLRRLLECLARDRTKHQVAEVTSLGLVQMTRKRVGAGLLEAFSQPCECCNGRGVILTYEPDGDGHPVPHVHTRATDNPGSNGAGHTSGANGSGAHGNGSGASGSGSGSGSSGGRGGRSRRGSRGRGSGGGTAPAAAPAPLVTPAVVAAQVHMAAAEQSVTEAEHVTEPDAGPDSGNDTLFDTSPVAEGAEPVRRDEAAVAATAETPAEPEVAAADTGRSSGRRRRRKPASEPEAAHDGAPVATHDGAPVATHDGAPVAAPVADPAPGPVGDPASNPVGEPVVAPASESGTVERSDQPL